MGTASLTLALMLGSVGVGPEAPFAMNERAIKIPYNLTVAPADVTDIILYVSIDQGKNWSRAAIIKPTEKYFPFQAPTDGQYWFNVAVMYRNGTQVPADVAQVAPQQKVIIDTQKPIVRINSADRMGEEVLVNWEIQEPNPDLASLKLEYRPTEASTGGFWVTVPTNPGLAGQARFRPNTPGPVTVRVTIQDQASNLGWSEKPVGTMVTANTPTITPTNASMQPTGVTLAPAAPAPVMPEPQAVPVPTPVTSPTQAINPPVAPVVQPPVAEPVPAATPLATSNQSLAPATPNYSSLRNDGPEVFYTNEPQVTIDYEVEHGPSGLGKIEVYLTQDDGRNWVKWQDLLPNDLHRGEPSMDNKRAVTVRLPDREGVFGYRLVPYSGAQMSAGAPQGGSEPEFRIQYDRTAPYVELFKPEGDPNQRNVLVLQWKATDANFGATPIRIYWSEKPEGDWHPVNLMSPLGGSEATPLPNTGRYNWLVPPGMPLKAYLRITAEDKAGNVAEAITPQPLLVDTQKPVGRFKGVIESKRRN
ncbi:MAG: hypothetical protein ACJ8C4_13540 [Gemmataceae bacterium]